MLRYATNIKSIWRVIDGSGITFGKITGSLFSFRPIGGCFAFDSPVFLALGVCLASGCWFQISEGRGAGEEERGRGGEGERGSRGAEEQRGRGETKNITLLPFAFCLLPSAFCLLPFAFCLLPSASCLLQDSLLQDSLLQDSLLPP